MREILSRAKRIDNGEWIEGNYVKAELIHDKGYEHYIIEIMRQGGTYEIDPETLCQYIGQTDKKGNKIWENDIVRYEFEATFDYRKKYREVVLIDDFTFYLIMPTLARCEELEVLGNRFDTPELLSQCINFLES